MANYTKIHLSRMGGIKGGDNHALLLSLLTNNPSKKVIVGDTTADIYYISKPLYLPENSCLEINGTLKLSNGQTRNLSADAHIGDTLIYVANANLYYSVGQFVSLTYDSMPLGGNGNPERQMGACSRVKSVTSTYVELDYPLRDSMQGEVITDFLVSDNARIGHTQSALIIEEVDNIVITGSGILDGNYPTMLDVHPNSLDTTLPLPGYEESRGGNGIIIWDVNNITIKGIKVQETNIAGMTLYKVNYFRFINLEIYHPCMKGIATTIEVRYGYLKNINISDSYLEDGLSFHDDTKYVTSEDITITNTQRQALACNADSSGNTFKNITISDGLIGMSVVSPTDSNFCENNIFKNITIDSCQYSLMMNRARNSQFDELIINGSTVRGYCIALGGDVSGIVFNGGGCYDTVTNTANGQGVRIIAKGSYSAEVTDVEFNDFEFKRLKKAISEESGGLASDIVFNECAISDNTSNGDVASEVFTFNDCIIE